MAGHSLDPAARLTVEGLPDPEEGAAISKVLRSIPFLIAGLCAAWAGAWLVEHGLSISRDGAHYLQVAFDVHFDGMRLGNPGYPVGYSALIALAMLLEPFPVDAAAWVSALSFALVLFVCADLFYRASRSTAVAALAVLALATLPAFWSSFLHVLSEPAFCALVVLHAWLVARHAERPDSNFSYFVAAAVVVGVVGVVRTIGYAVLLAFTLYALWCAFERRREPRELARLVAAHALSWLPVASIAIVRGLRGTKVHGSRTESSESLVLNLERTASAFPADLGWFALAGVGLCIGLLIWRSLRAPLPSSFSAEERAPRWIATYALLLVGIYVSAIIAAATLTRISPVGTRFYAPYYPLFVVLICCTPSLVPQVARRGTVLALCVGFLSLLFPDVRAVAALNREVAAVETADLVAHHQLGFDRNPATTGLPPFFRELASGRAPVNIGVLAPLPRGGQHPAMARALMFRSAAVDSHGVARFERKGSGHFVIRYSDLPSGGGLEYRDLPLLAWHDASGLAVHVALSREMGSPGRGEHWLLAPSFADPLHGLGSVPGSPLVVAESRELGAYRAHRFVWSPSDSDSAH